MQNLGTNDIASTKFNLSCTTLERVDITKYDFIAANIIAQVIVDIMPEIPQYIDLIHTPYVPKHKERKLVKWLLKYLKENYK